MSRLGGSNPLIQKINKINDGWKLFNTLSKVHQPTAHDLAYDMLRFHLSPTGNFLYSVDTPTS
ncbi:hypothetical protein FA868_14190 [Escherichia coli]|nr:hypothetical protein [Escherichia coli]EFC9527771.1 hypothetical protein [Escherichia coli]